LVGQGGNAVEIPANLWVLARWIASTLGGWQPAGTNAPAGWAGELAWKGQYEPPAGQTVTAADAAALAEALGKASLMYEAIARMPAEERRRAFAKR
jgi:hypothetical protein